MHGIETTYWLATGLAYFLGSSTAYWMYIEEGKKSKKAIAASFSGSLILLTVIAYPSTVDVIFACGSFFVPILMLKFALFIHSIDQKRATRKNK